MDNTEKLIIYASQTKNVRSILSSIRHMRREINKALLQNKKPEISTFTKLYFTLFCTWSEANFSKTIHTPHGFSTTEISEIQKAKSKNISAGWRKAANIGVGKLSPSRGVFQAAALSKLEESIDLHVFNHSLVRNKLAHGQWIYALNRENTKINQKITDSICDLNIVKIDIWRKSQEILTNLIEDLIESPEKSFIKNWDTEVENLRSSVALLDEYTLSGHMSHLKRRNKTSR